MNPKKVKILYENEVFDALIEEDKHFLDGEKVTFVNKNNTTCVYTKKLITILEDENT